MERKYWLDLYTGKTWEEFIKAGSSVTGFRYRRRKLTEKIRVGDFLICYITGISRIIGILEVKSPMFEDHTKIWEDSEFPCRFKVSILYQLKPEYGVQIQDLKNDLTIFKRASTPHAWTGFFRASPNEFKREDGEIIVKAILDAMAKPVFKEYDDKKYKRIPKTFESDLGVVTVPEDDEAKEQIFIPLEEKLPSEEKITHEEIQWLLLKLGSDMGLDVWVARNDQNKVFNGNSFGLIPRIRKKMPRQFDEATNRTIELIDVVWLQGDAIIAAFEVEHTSAIYSGLLRMSDLISMQPNIKIDLYIVSPDERAEKVFNEINRPTFTKLKPPLPKICKFIPYSKLKNEIEQMGERIAYVRPEFIGSIAESCEPDEA